jgi:hypothetical protein
MIQEDDNIARWIMRIVGRREHSTLARVLQKAAVPTIQLKSVAFADREDHVTIELVLNCSGSRARLTQAKIQKLAWIETCDIREQEVVAGLQGAVEFVD